jgi:hypothetical protein
MDKRYYQYRSYNPSSLSQQPIENNNTTLIVVIIVLIILFLAVIYLFFGPTYETSKYLKKDDYVPGIVGPTGPVGPKGDTGATGATGELGPYGGIIRVDQVYGDDTKAVTDPFSVSFLTINNALTYAQTVGTVSNPIEVFIQPGIYNESIVVPEYISIRGENVQAVTIQQLDVTSATTLVTLNNNTRLEDVTLRVSTSSENVTITGVEFIDNAAQSSKLRTAVVNVIATRTTGNAYGILSSGTTTSPSTVTSSEAVRATTINVTSNNTGGDAIGIYVSNANRFSIRDVNVFSTGSATTSTAVRTNDPNGVLYIKTSSLNGTLYDTARTSGTLILQATDLINSSTDGNSFAVTTSASIINYGLTSTSFNTAATYNLMPGTMVRTDTPVLPFNTKFDQKIVVINGIFSANVAPSGLNSATFNIYKNTTASIPVMTAVLNNSTPSVNISNISTTINTVDSLIVTLTYANTTSNEANSFLATLGIY